MKLPRLPRLRPLPPIPPGAVRLAGLTFAIAAALAAVGAWFLLISPRLVLSSLAALGIVAAVGALGSAESGKGATIAGALTTFALLAFACLAMIGAAVLLA